MTDLCPKTSRHLFVGMIALALSLSTFACSTTPDPVVEDNDMITAEAEEVKRDTGEGSLKEQETTMLLQTAQEAIAQSKWKVAVKAYDEAIALNPNKWELYVDKAILQSKVPDFPGSITTMEEAFKRGAKSDPKAWVELGNMYQNRGMYHESVKAYRAALGLEETPRVETLLSLSSAYIFIAHYDEALKTLSYVMQKAPNDPRVFHNQGLVYQLQKDLKAALKLYDTAIEADPNFAQVHYNRADVLKRLRRFDESIKSYQRYIELDPNGPYVKRANNMINLMNNNMDQAR